jgi:endonuclease YncB( thermonuclease family)
MNYWRKITLFFILLIIIPVIASGWDGKVVGVSDGDTITVLHDNKPEKIRLYGIDCPEKHQNFGQRAKQVASDEVFNKNVDIRPVTTDRYGRTVAMVYYDGNQSLNEKLLESGMAWVYPQYCLQPQCRDWAIIENNARLNKRGLWTIPSPEPPWEFRRSPSKASTDTGKALIATPRNFNYSPTKSSSSVERSPVITGVGTYHGNTSSRKFHRSGCRHYDCSNCTAVFSGRNDAIRAGYGPCGVCNP